MRRTFELSTHVKAISRSDGTTPRRGWAKRGRPSKTPRQSRSATSAAAYRACCVIECEREGRTHDFTRKRGLRAAEITLPTACNPRWARDRSKLWNKAEMVERNGKRGKNAGQFKANAQTARDCMYSLPVELSDAGMLTVMRIVAQYLADKHGVAVDCALHEPGRKGDQRNFHVHMLMTTRRVTQDGLGEKAREWDDPATGPQQMNQLRAFIAQTQNDVLKAEGKAEVVFVECRSFKARGSAQVPTRHTGQHGHIQSKQRGRATKAWTATQRKDQKDRHDKELAALKFRQDFALQGKLAALSQRGREGAAAIRRELQEQRRADTAATGLRRVFLIVTGREGRDAFDRQARDGQRIAAANEKIKALKTEIRAERSAFATAQTKDRAALIERHGIEDRQLSQTATSREFADKAADRAARQPVERTQTREQEQQRGQDRGREPSP